MFQYHPLNVNGKLLRRFYEPLILLAVLDPTRGAQRPDLITDRGLDEPSKLWRNFLDQLSWLCDTDTGGDTVTAIAVQRTVECSCFWVTANSNSRNKARQHLIWLFEQLSQLYTSNTATAYRIEQVIVARCIEFSSRRVKAYRDWLLRAIDTARSVHQEDINIEDSTLWSGLREVERLASDPLQLCAFAYAARRQEFVQILCRRHQSHASRGVWSDIRHYLGRLGSWTKAVQILSRAALRFPQHIENAQVQVVEPCAVADRPDKKHLTDLEGLVQRMLPSDQQVLVAELRQALVEVDSVASIRGQFRDSYSNVRPRPHAELLILEHFYQNKFEFVADDRYIGCSKPSCYCCHNYMQLHPGGFAPRPCHGNLWINWAPPIPLPPLESKANLPPRPQDHHTFKMMQELIPRIRQDLQEQILSKRPRRAKLPDSTTGMSSIIGTAWPMNVQKIGVQTGSFDESTDCNVFIVSAEAKPHDGQPQDSIFERQDSQWPDPDATALIAPASKRDRCPPIDTESEDIVLFKGRRA